MKNITCNTVLVDGMYNDLGFQVKDRLFILVEAQSTWSVNIIVRAFMYLAKTYKEYFDLNACDLYAKSKVELPRPELYVVYSGERKKHPKEISLKDEFFGGEEASIEVKVKMLYGEDKNNIVGEYVLFCKIVDEQVKLYGKTNKAISEAIRICKDKNVLKKYLEEHEKEVHDIMFTLYDEEQIRKNHEARLVREAEKKGIEKGIEKGETKKAREAAFNMAEMGIDTATIAKALKEDVKIINEWLSA